MRIAPRWIATLSIAVIGCELPTQPESEQASKPEQPANPSHQEVWQLELSARDSIGNSCSASGRMTLTVSATSFQGTIEGPVDCIWAAFVSGDHDPSRRSPVAGSLSPRFGMGVTLHHTLFNAFPGTVVCSTVAWEGGFGNGTMAGPVTCWWNFDGGWVWPGIYQSAPKEKATLKGRWSASRAS